MQQVMHQILTIVATIVAGSLLGEEDPEMNLSLHLLKISKYVPLLHHSYQSKREADVSLICTQLIGSYKQMCSCTWLS